MSTEVFLYVTKRKKTSSASAKNIRRHRINFSRPGRPGARNLCTPTLLSTQHCNFKMMILKEMGTAIPEFASILNKTVGRDSVVGIATRYGLDGPGIESQSRSQWPCGLRRGSSAARLLGLWVRIPPGAWMFVLCCCKDGSMERSDMKDERI
jgi:hypothetical protein